MSSFIRINVVGIVSEELIIIIIYPASYSKITMMPRIEWQKTQNCLFLEVIRYFLAYTTIYLKLNKL